jgi:hypothetical protein
MSQRVPFLSPEREKRGESNEIKIFDQGDLTSLLLLFFVLHIFGSMMGRNDTFTI